MSTLKFIDVNKIYSNNVQAVFNFNLDINDKDFVVFVGPSGCGKSTTLRMVAGLEEITDGEIYIDDVLINEVAPKDRNIAMVFQNYALYPHMTVFDNMAFSLKLRKDHFPVYELDSNNPEYIEKYQQLLDESEKETSEGIAKIKAGDKNKKHRKTVKERVKEFVFTQNSKLGVRVAALQKEYSTQVLTFDKEKVDALVKEARELQKANPVDQKALDDKLEEIRLAREERVKPLIVYRHYNRQETVDKVTRAAETLGLTNYLKRKPAALSGGQRQRVALGRAIVRNPKVFLMDEPLSNLDAKLRVQMRSEITKIHKLVGATTIYVTHDQTEAMTMATKIVCMNNGYIQQIGSPKELFNEPANTFVAGFIGSPAMNLLNGKFDGKSFVIEGTDFKIDLNKQFITKLKDYVGKDVILGARPEDIYVKGDESIKSSSNLFSLTCDISELLGRELVIYNQINNQRLIVKTNKRDDITSGDKAEYFLDLNRIHFFDPNTTNRI